MPRFVYTLSRKGTLLLLSVQMTLKHFKNPKQSLPFLLIYTATRNDKRIPWWKCRHWKLSHDGEI